MNELDNGNSVGYVLGGLGLVAVIAITLFSVPSWVLLVAILTIGTVLSGGNLDLAERQLQERLQSDREAKLKFAESKLPIATSHHQEIANRKFDILLQDPKRLELLKDLEIIGNDVTKYENKTLQEIERSLSKEDKVLLREMKGFLS